MNGFIDLTNIESIKSLPKDIIVDNWIELNYLYNKALVEDNSDIISILNDIINISNIN